MEIVIYGCLTADILTNGSQNCFLSCPLHYICILSKLLRGWLGVVKVSGSLCHLGVQLILASNWARSAILVASKDRGRMFLFLLFLHFHSCSTFFPVPLFHLLYYLFSPIFWETRQRSTRVDMLNPNTIKNQTAEFD